jgi:hypothetical protein
MSKWRKKWKIHPAAEVFPMMPEDELQALSEDIKANGLREPYRFWQDGATKLLLDGRNRLEAMERAGLEPNDGVQEHGDPVAFIISKNIRRRHLTKEQQADLLVAARKADEDARTKAKADKYISKDGKAKPGQVGPVSNKGGRGKKNALKSAVMADAKPLGISERTVKRALAKASGKKPSQALTVYKKPKTEPIGKVTIDAGIESARANYIAELELLSTDEEWNEEVDRFLARVKELRV